MSTHESDSPPPKRRRTEGLRTGGRSARVVSEVLRATLEELGRVGYSALRIEDVAARSGVNKTTIYRRWPTKADLVGSAIRSTSVEMAMPDTGSLREDLVRVLRASAARFGTREKLGLIRVLQAERGHPEVDALARTLRAEHRAPRVAIVERAIARGELPPGTDAELVVEVLLGTIYGRTMHLQGPVEEDFVESVVDFVVAGAKAGGAIRRPRANA